ncbi:MAG: ATP-binding protein [Eubacteriales bacterium]
MYNRDNFVRIRREFEQKSMKAKDDAYRRQEELHRKLPDLRSIDAALADTGLHLMREIAAGKDGLGKRIERLRAENEQLQHDRAACLRYYGYPEDYTDVHYDCPLCSDTGFVGMKVCRCMRSALVEAGYESSGIGNLLKTQSFETFDIEYYRSDARAYENIKNVFSICRAYAGGFTEKNHSSLLLLGATGLGKTHISTSIAKVVIERGYDVVYDTAQNIFADFEYERFGKSGQNGENERTRRYFECDLLIMDDLGTEMTNQFTVSCLYNLINTRLNADRSIIINTNLQRDELRKRYSDRITSRLFGEFSPLVFIGRDIRELKLHGGNRP